MTTTIAVQLEQLKHEFEQKRKSLMEPARLRLQEIDRTRDELDREEEELRELLGEKKAMTHNLFTGPKRQRRSSGKRMTAQHKKEVVARFVASGHIKANTDLSRELRAALTGEGLGNHDLRILQNYMPAGWQARSNGQRGLLAKTTFHHG